MEVRNEVVTSKKGFLEQLCSKEFWLDFFTNLVLEFIRGFSLALGGLITYYATEKLGRSILPPSPPKITTTTPPPPPPPPPPSPISYQPVSSPYYSGNSSTGSERFPGFK